MRKFRIIFFIIFLLSFLQANANRDDTFERFYWSKVSNPYTANINIINTACDSTETYSWNIFSVLNIWYTDPNIVCEKRFDLSWEGLLYCEYTDWFIDWTPFTYFTKEISLIWTYQDIMMNLWIPEKIYSWVNADYEQKFNLKMNIIVDSNWTKIEDLVTKYDFSDAWIFDLGTFYYHDSSLCDWENLPIVNNECEWYISTSKYSYDLDQYSENWENKPIKITQISYNWETYNLNVNSWIQDIERFVDWDNFWIKINNDKKINLVISDYDNIIDIFKSDISVDFNISDNFVSVDSCSIWYELNDEWICQKIQDFNYFISWLECPVIWPLFWSDLLIPDWWIEDNPVFPTLLLTDDIIAPKISSLEITWCNYNYTQNAYICYADEQIDFSIKLQTIWSWYSPLWITEYELSINDFNWNLIQDASKTNWELLVDNWIKSFSSQNSKFSLSWQYNLEFTFKWDSLNPSTWLIDNSLRLIIIPNNEIKKDWEIELDNYKILSNGSDKISICQDIVDSFWNNILDKDEYIYNISITDWIFRDQKENRYEAVKINNERVENSSICFDIKSIAPEKKELEFEVEFYKHAQNIAQNRIYEKINFIIKTPVLEFEKLYTWRLTINPDYWNVLVWSWYTLWLEILDTDLNIDPNINLDNNLISYILPWWDYIPTNITNDINKSFSFILNYNWDDLTQNSKVNLSVSPYIIDFVGPIWLEQRVVYKLSNTREWNSNWPIEKDFDTWFLWVKIIWDLQWDWNQEVIWEDSNYTDLSKLDLKSDLRKNAYLLTKWLISWQVVNWIKYVEWDFYN